MQSADQVARPHISEAQKFQNFQLNRNLQRIPFKIMYNMSILRHWFFLSYSVSVYILTLCSGVNAVSFFRLLIVLTNHVIWRLFIRQSDCADVEGTDGINK